MSEKYVRLNRRFKHLTGGFSLVELLVVVVIIGILSAVSFAGVNQVKRRASNEKMLDDLLFIANALEDYRRDHNKKLPMPEPSTDPAKKINQNVLCFYKDATYAHDCGQAEFVQGMIDNNLLSKRYLREVPVDPRTGSRYIYGVSRDRQYFQVAGVYDAGGKYEARMAGNLIKGYELPSIIRAFDGPNFVLNGQDNLPYNPDHLTLTGTLQEVTKGVEVIKSGKPYPGKDGMSIQEKDIIKTNGGKAAVYLSDGSITQIDPNSEILMEKLTVGQNDKNGTITKVVLNLKKGKIWNKVARLAKSSTYEIKSGNTIAGVRGTEFGVDATTGLTEVLEGEVTVTGAPKPVKSNQEWDGQKIAQLSNPQNIVNRYYKEIPLHTGVEPHLIAAKTETIQGSPTPKLQIRNINHFVDEVNQKPNRGGRSMKANRLAIYGDNYYKAIDISSQPQKFYEVSDPALLGKTVQIRFEECENNSDLSKPCTDINLENLKRKSSFSSAKLKLETNTDLGEKEIYPNLKGSIQKNPKLLLSTPSIITSSEPDFNLKLEVDNYQNRTLKPITIKSLSTTICTAPTNPGGSNPPNPTNITITLKGKTGSCDLEVSAELDNSTLLKEKLSVQIVAQGQRLFLKLPADGSTLNRQGQRVTLSWETPNIQSGARFDVNISGPPNFTPPQIRNIPQYEFTTPQLSIPGPYQWDVTMNYNGKTETAGPFTFTISKSLALDFDVMDPQQTPLVFNNDTVDYPSQTNTQNLRFPIEVTSTALQSIQSEHPKAIYEWDGSTPSVKIPDPAKPWEAVIEIDKSKLTQPGDSIFAKINLTVRDQNKNIVGGKTKKMTVEYLPPITSIAFDFSSNSVQPKNDGLTTWKIPKVVINGLATHTFEAKYCDKLTSTSAGDVTGKEQYTIPTRATKEDLTCTLNANTKAGGFKVYGGPLTAGNVSVSFGAPTPNLATTCSQKGGVYENNGCWFVAKLATESCNDVCVTQNSLKCVDNQNWTIGSQLCVDLGNAAGQSYSLNSSALATDYSPVIFSGSQCKNDTDNLHSCAKPASNFYQRICKCTQ